MLVSTTTIGAALPLLHGLRLRRVQMWAANRITGVGAPSPTQLQLEFRTNNADFGNPSRIYQDFALGATDIAHIDAKPLKDSFSGSWLPYASTDEVLRLTCPLDTIVDFEFDCVLLDGEAATGFAAAGATTTTIGGYTLAAMSPLGLPDFG